MDQMRVTSAIVGLVLAWVTSTSGQAAQCGMDEHACCAAGQARISSGADCPLVSPAVPDPAAGERLSPVVISVAETVVAIEEPVEFVVSFALPVEPSASPPGLRVLRI